MSLLVEAEGITPDEVIERISDRLEGELIVLAGEEWYCELTADPHQVRAENDGDRRTLLITISARVQEIKREARP